MSPAHIEPIGVNEEQARTRSTITLYKIFEALVSAMGMHTYSQGPCSSDQAAPARVQKAA